MKDLASKGKGTYKKVVVLGAWSCELGVWSCPNSSPHESSHRHCATPARVRRRSACRASYCGAHPDRPEKKVHTECCHRRCGHPDRRPDLPANGDQCCRRPIAGATAPATSIRD